MFIKYQGSEQQMPLKPRELAYAAMFAAVIAASALITRFMPAVVVPYSLQTLRFFSWWRS